MARTLPHQARFAKSPRSEFIRKTAIAFLVAVSLAGCSQTTTQQVGNHTFRVPKKHLIAEFEPSHLSFVLNPEAALQDRVLIGLDTIQRTCPRGFTEESNPDAYLCSKQSLVSPSQTPVAAESLKKQMGNLGNAAWRYSLHDNGGDRVFSSCTASSAKDDRGGFCSALAAYKDLVFMIRINEVDVVRLPTLVHSVETILSSWEAAAR